MGNLCGKLAHVEPADGQAAGSRQASTTPGTRVASKSQAAAQPEPSGGSVKKQQPPSEQQHKKVQWSIPAEPPGQQEQTTTSSAEQQPTAAAADDAQPVCKKRTDCKVKDAYKLGKTLGTGGFAIVKLATDKKTGEQFAVKIMTLPPAGVEPGDNENTREDIFKEIDILCGLNHENVVYLKEYFEEGNKVYLITELVTGGELLEAVLQRGSYSEGEARLAFVQLLRGIQYLHSKNVVHRDLKLENLLLASPDDITKVKIADFGLAKQSADAMSTVCGTPQYVAPEVIQGTSGTVYGPAVDMWSAGVVLFILLGGYPPFWSENEPALFEQIRRGKYSFDDPVWDVISHSAKDLISKLLIVHPNQRLTATQCLEHPWVTAGSVPSNPLTAARNKMQALSMKAPGFAAAMAAAEALGEEAVATGVIGGGVAVGGEMGQAYAAAGGQ
ncbi:hypothetical protein OEZ85_006039 [Tetradesmus obliquus]|uniref:Protein kinase domain-containing protein n=1 Tax=Tetradesmus obliquus TaxID=3088 RepID=A0ABY8UJ33_TETOB|nr:hypothetical protein OEZ85_006039 [Tetradesmus obliquus]